MIGAGVFTTSGFALSDLGNRRYVMIAWLVGGIIALCGAVSYGGLARRIRGSGGEYLFLSRTVHPIAGAMAGWVSLLAGFTGAIAYAAITFEAYSTSLLPPSLAELPNGVIALSAIVVCATAHSLAIRPGILAQNGLIGFKLAMLIGLIAYAAIRWAAGEWDGWRVAEARDSTFSITAIALSLVWISLSFSGFNAAVYVAGEVADAEHDVPKSLWIGTLLTFIVYLALNFVFVYAPLPDAVKGVPEVALAAANSIGDSSISLIIQVVIIVSLFSSVSAMIVAGPRVYAQMAEDGVLPSWLRMYQFRPTAAVWLQAVIAAVVALRAELQGLLTYLGLTLSLSAAGTVCCLFVIHRREGKDSIRVPGYPLTPIIFVAATVGLGLLSASRRPKDFVAMLITLAIGALAYGLQATLLGGKDDLDAERGADSDCG